MATATKLLVSKRELSEMLTICPRQIDYMVEAGRIPALKLGTRLVRYEPEKVLAALQNHCEAAASKRGAN